MKKFLFVGIVFTLFGCAVAPENIQPNYVSEMSYSNWTCDQLEKEQARLVPALQSAYENQRRCRQNDVAGVLFLGFPVSPMSGCNDPAKLAKLKGELDSVQRAAALNRCNLPPVPQSIFEEKIDSQKLEERTTSMGHK